MTLDSGCQHTETTDQTIHCRVCHTPIGRDPRRYYCDKHREYRRGRWRRRGRNRQYFQEKHHQYSLRTTRVTGTGFSEHMRRDRKTRRPDFNQERRAVHREHRRQLIAQKHQRYQHYPEPPTGTYTETPPEPIIPLTRVQLYKDWRYWKPNRRRRKKTTTSPVKT